MSITKTTTNLINTNGIFSDSMWALTWNWTACFIPWILEIYGKKLISNLLATTTTNILYSYHELNLFLWYGPFNINWFKIQRIIQQILCVYLKIAENWTNLRPRSLSLCVSRIKNFSQLLLHTRQVQTHVHARIITKLLLFKLLQHIRSCKKFRLCNYEIDFFDLKEK